MPGTTTSQLPLCAAALLTGAYILLSLPSLDAEYMQYAVLPALLTFIPGLKKWRLPALIFLLGFSWAGLITGHQLAASLPHALAGKNILVEGHIEGLPERDGRVLRFNLDVFRSDVPGDKQITGKIRVSDYRSQFIDPQPGEAWRFLLRVKSPHGFSNPAGFDYEKWLFNQKIIATAYIRDIKSTRADSLTANHRLPGLDRQVPVDTMRLRLARQIEEYLSESPYHGLITALATGDRRSIGTQQWLVLQKTGTSHLMAISGLHVGLVAGITFLLFRFFFASLARFPLYYPAHKAAAIAALFFALFYSLLAGFSLPTQRALLMLSIVTISLILDRRVQPENILALTLIVILIFDPLSILSAGFWLSFSAVVMILLTLMFRQKSFSWPVNGVIKAMRLQWKLSLMMAPLSLLFFQQIPLAGPLANLIAIPVVGFLIVPLVLLASMSYLLFGSGIIDRYLFQLAEYLLQYVWLMLDYLLAAAEILSFSPEHSLVALAGIIFTVLMFIIPAGLKLRRLALVGLLVFFWPFQNMLRDGEFRMILLDVGQGLSVIIMTAKHTLLFDTGARFSRRFNAGDAVVVPVLKSFSVSKLDTMIVSHGDNDHSGGAESILAAMKVRRFISNESALSNKSEPCHAGLQWLWDGVLFRVLHPQRTAMVTGNNASCVLHVQSQYGSVLLPADIEEESEQEVLSRYQGTLASSILVAPHHGSKTSSSETFIDAVDPQLVMIPAGWMNRYQHPAEIVTRRLADRGIASIATGECGSISARIVQEGIIVEAWRQTNRKIWDRTETDRRCRKVVVGLPEIPAL